MRKLFLPLLLIMIISFASCEYTKMSEPGLQARIDSVLFKANDVIGSLTEDGNVIIQGFNTNQTVTLNASGAELTDYPLGANSTSYATYEDGDGIFYSTIPDGNGSITFTQNNLTEGWYSGEFEFTAVSEFGTMVRVSQGVFFKAPISEFVEDEEQQGSSDGFSANVGGAPFVPINVLVAASENFITISGATTSTTLLVRVPIDVSVGNYSLPANGFLASYSEGQLTETAISGNISIITHDTVARTISGSFSFNTQGQSVQSGQFNVSY